MAPPSSGDATRRRKSLSPAPGSASRRSSSPGMRGRGRRYDSQRPPSEVHQKPLLHRHQVLHLPHAAKNKFVLTAWRQYEHPLEAVYDHFHFLRFRLNNETMNVLTALLALVTLFFTHAVVYSHGDILSDAHEAALRNYGLACGLNALLVAAYHALAPYAKWYDAASAMDLGAIALVAWASQGVSFLIPGASAFAAYLDSVDAGQATANVAYSFLREWFAPLLQAVLGGDAALDTRTVAFYFTSSVCVVIGAYASIRRTLVSGETPFILLGINFLCLLFNVVDLAIAAPRPMSYMAAVMLFGGGSLYAAKIPERFFMPRQQQHEQEQQHSPKTRTSKGTGKKTDAAVACASLHLPASLSSASHYRLVDIFSSHVFHHIAYCTSMMLCAADFAWLAMRSGCNGMAGTSAAADPRCAPFLPGTA